MSVVGRRWRRHGWLVVALALGAAWPVSAVTGKAREFVLQADQLQATPDASDESVRRAVALYEEAARLEPNSVEIQLKLADAALTVAAWTSGDRLRWYQLGKTAAERAVALDQDNAEALFLLAANRGRSRASRGILEGSSFPRSSSASCRALWPSTPVTRGPCT